MNDAGAAVIAFTRLLDNGTPTATDDKVTVDASFRPAGGPYGPVETVSTQNGVYYRYVAATIDAAGNVLLVFTTNNGTNRQVQASHRSPDGGWSPPVSITPVEAGNDASNLSLDGNAAGNVAVFWSRSDTAQGAVGTTTGPITALGPLSVASGSVFGGQGNVAVDDAGNASWAWERDLPGLTNYVVEVRDKPYGQPLGPIATITPNVSGAKAEGPSIDLDPSGRGIVTYGYHNDGGTPVPQETRYSVRAAPDGNWSAGTWSGDVRRASSSGQVTNNYGSQVAMTPDGSAVVVYFASDSKPWAASRATGQQFTGHQALSDTTTSSAWLAVGRDGTAVAALRDNATGRVRASVGRAGSPFGATLDVGPAPPAEARFQSSAPVVGVDAAGNAILAGAQNLCPTGCTAVSSSEIVVHFDGASPVLRSVSVPASGVPGAPVDMSASAFDQFSSPSVAWDFGDGASGSGGSASHAFAQPGSYAVKVTATDSLGNATSETRNVTVAFADADGDGAASNVDCNDANPAVKPGAKEIPGNGVDDDCSAGDALKRVGTTVKASWRVGKRSTAVRRLGLRKLPAGAVATVACAGRGCPLKSKRLTFKKPRKSASLTRLFNRRASRRSQRVIVARLRPGTKVTITVTAPGRAPRVTTFTIRVGKPPTVARS